MSKTAIVYWSGTGNTEALANKIYESAKSLGKDVQIFTAGEFSEDKVGEFDTVIYGCPSMGCEQLEDFEFEPMFESCKPKLKDKSIALFGSYGWGGSYMQDWEARVQADGAELLHPGVLAMGEPDDAARQECKEIGSLLAKA